MSGAAIALSARIRHNNESWHIAGTLFTNIKRLQIMRRCRLILKPICINAAIGEAIILTRRRVSRVNER